MRVLKCGGIAVACAAIVVLSSFTLSLCSAWLLRSVPLAHTVALTALSLCGSGVSALMEFSDRHRQRNSMVKKPSLRVFAHGLASRLRFASARPDQNDTCTLQ
jgi:hypothetical protein